MPEPNFTAKDAKSAEDKKITAEIAEGAEKKITRLIRIRNPFFSLRSLRSPR